MNRSWLPRPGLVVNAPAIGVALLLAVTVATAGPLRHLARDEELCDPEETICLDATLSYEYNARLLWLHGRVRFAPGPGRLTITVQGTTRLGYVRYAPMEVDLHGNATEIVDFRMIPDHPDVEDWKIYRIEFASTEQS
jgi:hypothetical protein